MAFKMKTPWLKSALKKGKTGTRTGEKLPSEKNTRDVNSLLEALNDDYKN